MVQMMGPNVGSLTLGSLHTYCRPYTLFVPLRSQRLKGPYERTVLPTLELTIWGNLGLRDGSRIQGFFWYTSRFCADTRV